MVESDLRCTRQLTGTHLQQPARSRGRERDAQHSAGHCEYEALCHELAHQPSSPCTERGSHGELSLARRGTREQKAGQIRAGEEQHERDGAEEYQQSRARAPDHHVVQRFNRGRVPRAVLRILFAEPPRYRGHLGAAPLESHARLQPRHHIEHADLPQPWNPVVGDRGIRDVHVDPFAGVAEVAGHDAEHFVRLAAESEDPADHGRRAGELPLPERV